VDNRDEIRDFLVSRRARITPEQAGLAAYGRNRRVSGLRREEVATLAGISVEYYTRLERGTASGVSAEVLEAIVRALRLDEAERAHLFDLVRTANSTRVPRRQPPRDRVRPMVQRIIDSLGDIPAYVRNGLLDILAANRLGAALYSELLADPVQPANMARFIFLNPAAGDFFADWDGIANDAVAILRAKAGRDPYDQRLTNLIGELSTRSKDFRVRWAAHNVKLACTYVKTLHHPVVGDLTLTWESLHLPNDPDQRVLVYAAEPGSPSDEALKLLASWTATPTEASVRNPVEPR
jgi:transcriptional regulator with XRE-family HTH domain